jgi:hypothetical protein
MELDQFFRNGIKIKYMSFLSNSPDLKMKLYLKGHGKTVED